MRCRYPTHILWQPYGSLMAANKRKSKSKRLPNAPFGQRWAHRFGGVIVH